ncbi:hypothetical protein PV328_007586 [Microctonus aethiopoides]|nr:hypothetical protein PV328_007586 [Microctonus aethiopoides]
MFEYYESAQHINISKNCNIGARGWQSCARMLKKTHCLEQFDAKDIVLTQQHMNILKRPLQLTTHLQILKLENCNLTGRAFVVLMSAMKLNAGVKELYLANNHLNEADGAQLGSLLRVNRNLQLLDVSNNNLEDLGAQEILAGLIVQANTPLAGKGLSILIMWNNHLTKELSGNFSELMAQSKNLETLNIGKNAMSDEFLEICKDSLKSNKYLLQLGLQSTGLILKSVMALAEIIEFNATLQRIDLRDNNIQLTPLTFLSLALKKNETITQIDLDDTPGNSKSQPLIEQYGTLVGEIRGYCLRNSEPQSIDSSTEDTTSSPQQRSRLSSCSSRKISLTCQTLPRSPPTMATTASGIMANEVYGRTTIISETKRTSGGRLRSPAPSPIPSPVASPIPSPSRNRFVVSRVSEQTLNNSNNSSASSSPITTPSSLSASPTCFFPSTNGVITNSRFRVTIVEPTTLSTITTTTTTTTTTTSSISVSLPVNNIVTTSSNSNVTVGFNCITRNSNISFDNKSISTDNYCELNKSGITNKNNDNKKLNNIETTSSCDKILLDKSQNYTSSLDKLLGLFQHPGNLFTGNFIDNKTKNENPLHSSMSSLMELGDKFHQYLRDGRSDKNDSKNNDKQLRLTSSASQLYNSTDNDDNHSELHSKSLIEINIDKSIHNNSDNNLSTNCLNRNSSVPELLNHDNNLSLIDKSFDDNIMNKSINNHVNELCDNSSTNCSINSSYSNDNSHCNINDKHNLTNVNNVNSELFNYENDDKLIISDSSADINCHNNDDNNDKTNLKLIITDNNCKNDDNEENDDQINCETTFDDDINDILTSILDKIPLNETIDCLNNHEQLSQYNNHDEIINNENKDCLIDNNVNMINGDIANCNNEQTQSIDNDIIRKINDDIVRISDEQFNEIIAIDKLELSIDTNNDKQTDTIIDEPKNSYSWINNKSSALTILSDDLSLNSIDNNDLTTTISTRETEGKLEINSANENIIGNVDESRIVVNSTKNDKYKDKLLDNNYLDSGETFEDNIIHDFGDITLHDRPVSSDASLIFEHNSETSSNIDTLSENPSSSRDSIQKSIDSDNDDLLFKDKCIMENKLTINIPIINDNEYLSRDLSTIDELMIRQSNDENKLPMDTIEIDEDNTNTSNDIVNTSGLK